MPIQPKTVITDWISATHSHVVPNHLVKQKVMKDAASKKYLLAFLHLAKLERMRAVLGGCPDGWWEILNKQGNNRWQLKGINEIGSITGEGVRQQIEAMMHLYLDFIKNEYPCLRFWRVGALQTKPNTQSQYKKLGNQLHSDYSETALRREPGERPMLMIMALDESFDFLYEDKDVDNDDDDNIDEDDICSLRVNGGHAIAFTNELFHAGGEDNTAKFNYRLFAYHEQ
jgi:hypothetical protein